MTQYKGPYDDENRLRVNVEVGSVTLPNDFNLSEFNGDPVPAEGLPVIDGGGWSSTNITTKTTTTVKNAAGIMKGIQINKVGSTDTLVIKDNATVLGSITVLATDTWREFPATFATSIVVVSGGGTAGDYTVFWR